MKNMKYRKILPVLVPVGILLKRDASESQNFRIPLSNKLQHVQCYNEKKMSTIYKAYSIKKINLVITQKNYILVSSY